MDAYTGRDEVKFSNSELGTLACDSNLLHVNNVSNGMTILGKDKGEVGHEETNGKIK